MQHENIIRKSLQGVNLINVLIWKKTVHILPITVQGTFDFAPPAFYCNFAPEWCQ